MSASLAEVCFAEVESLHRFFAEWFKAELEQSQVIYQRLARALAPGFMLVTPSGLASEREVLLEQLYQLHGSRAGQQFEIEVRQFRARWTLGDLCLATYEEHQRVDGEQNARLSSALFQRNDQAPGGVRWLHVHETGLKTGAH